MRSRTLKAVMGLTVAGAMVVWSPAATAATAQQNLGVGATINVNCTIATTAIAFGTYDPVVTNASTPLDAQGTVTIACTKGATAQIGLNGGLNTTREMSDGGTNRLSYQLYSDSGHSTVWGNTAGSWVTPVAAPSKAGRTFDVYGRVGANQDVPAGSYTDTVVATVNF